MTTLGLRAALKVCDCAAAANSSHLSGGMALGQIPGSQLLFTGVSFVWPTPRSRIQVQRPLPFPQLRWPSAGIGIRIALPCAEGMLAMRWARAMVPKAGLIGQEITQPRR
jgi:hypothetical protein